VGIDPHSVGARLLAWKPPLLPVLVGRIVDADVARVPLANPQPAFRIRPHAARALILGRRLINSRRAVLQIDIGEITTGQRHEPDIAFGCAGYPIGPGPLGCVPDLHVACRRVEPAVLDAVLFREPDATLAVESGGVEVSVEHTRGRQRAFLDLLRRRIDAHNGVLAAVGEPGGPIRPDDDTVRRGTLAECNSLDLAGGWVQSAGNAEVLARAPNLSAWADRHIVRIVAFWQLVVFGLLSVRGCRSGDQNS